MHVRKQAASALLCSYAKRVYAGANAELAGRSCLRCFETSAKSRWQSPLKQSQVHEAGRAAAALQTATRRSLDADLCGWRMSGTDGVKNNFALLAAEKCGSSE